MLRSASQRAVLQPLQLTRKSTIRANTRHSSQVAPTKAIFGIFQKKPSKEKIEGKKIEVRRFIVVLHDVHAEWKSLIPKLNNEGHHNLQQK
jgi:hypothetical protein